MSSVCIRRIRETRDSTSPSSISIARRRCSLPAPAGSAQQHGVPRVAQRRRDELGARRPIRREAPPLVTFADPRPLAEVLGIGHGDVGNRRPELLAPGAGVDIHYGYRAGVQSFELAVVGAALTARRKYKLGPAVARERRVRIKNPGVAVTEPRRVDQRLAPLEAEHAVPEAAALEQLRPPCVR